MGKTVSTYIIILAINFGGWLVPGDWGEWSSQCGHAERLTMDTCIGFSANTPCDDREKPPTEREFRYIQCPGKANIYSIYAVSALSAKYNLKPRAP